MKKDNYNSTELNFRPKGNKNIDQNRMVFTKTFQEIIVLWDDTIQIVFLGPNAVINKIAKSKANAKST